MYQSLFWHFWRVPVVFLSEDFNQEAKITEKPVREAEYDTNVEHAAHWHGDEAHEENEADDTSSEADSNNARLLSGIKIAHAEKWSEDEALQSGVLIEVMGAGGGTR